MKIASPISRPGEVPSLAKAGAGEFYCGVAPDAWQEKFGFVESISRRNSPRAHVPTLRDMEDLIRRAHRRGIPVHGVLNESYHQAQMGILEKQAGDYLDAGADGIILGDVASLYHLRNRGISGPFTMGTGGVAFNLETLDYYHQLKVSRVILPRHLDLDQIRHLIKQGPSMEYEVFIFRGLCPFIDGLCRFQHGINHTLNAKPSMDLACSAGFRVKCLMTCQKGKLPRSASQNLTRRQSLTGCGLCALWDLENIPGITALKVVGREFSSREKLENLKMVAGALDLLKEKPTKYEFFQACQELFREFFRRDCTGKDCYHPEITS